MGKAVSELLADALRAGRIAEAAALIPRLERSPHGSVLALETLYFLGDGEHVRVEGRKLLESPSLTAGQLSRCALIIARQLFDDGLSEDGVQLLRIALTHAQRANALTEICLATAALLERTCDCAAFDASLPLAAQTRRAAARCGDAQVAATVHLTFGRLEGRAGRFQPARRHFAIARELLRQTPNLRLSSAADNDESSLLFFVGDLDGARTLATRAAATAKESGWPKGITMAAGNLAYMAAAQDNFEEAEAHLRLVSRQPFRSPIYEFALSDTRALIAFRMGQFDVAADLLASHQGNQGPAVNWYQLETELTRIRILLRLERWDDAIKCADTGLEKARAVGAQRQAVAFQFARTEALIGAGDELGPADRFLNLDQHSWPVKELGSFWLVLGKVLHVSGLNDRATAYVRRAVRLFHTIGTKASGADANAVLANLTEVEGHSIPGARSPVDGDSFIALLDVADHPRILARETFAVLDEAQCVVGMALLGVSKTGRRVIDSRNWNEREALAAGNDTDGFESTVIGDDGDETLKIVAHVRTELEHRYSFAMVRRLVCVAADLRRYRDDEKQRAALWPAEALEPDSDSIWASEQMSEVLNIARRIAPTPLSLLLTGETGTGKEMLARAIHRASDRADRILLPFNCTAVPRDMLESQLFGYRKGAFTGADTSFQGVIRSAAGGTLFLDEIADVSLDVQPKLLRFLETHEIHPLGEPQPIKVDVRIIAATNANLEQLVADGKFREDLFYRLNVVRLRLPPLRERREEIPPLVHHYLRKFGDEQKKGQLTLADETLEYLLLYAWPGNVRQLANEVRRMVALADPDSALTPSLLSPEIQASRRTIPATADPPVASEPEIRVRLDQPLPLAVEMLEQTMIRSALSRSRGRVEEAAKLLGISRKGLFLKRRRWNLDQQQAS
jgi:DNA-binding NtrC family response regulator/tetratricopeptide (TPR) repeat protein